MTKDDWQFNLGCERALPLLPSGYGYFIVKRITEVIR